MPPFHKAALLIDGQNLHFTAKALGFDIDFKRLRVEFEQRGTVVAAYYYSTFIENGGYSSVKRLMDWLSYNGFTVVTKSVKEHDGSEEGRRKFNRTIGVELSVDAFEIARHVDEIIIFSGDGDLRPLVEALQRKGRYVTIVSSLRTSMIADDLRRQADEFIELNNLRHMIGRTLPSSAA
jgi:uncharacterized LabA/DUF88 family protein